MRPSPCSLHNESLWHQHNNFRKPDSSRLILLRVEFKRYDCVNIDDDPQRVFFPAAIPNQSAPYDHVFRNFTPPFPIVPAPRIPVRTQQQAKCAGEMHLKRPRRLMLVALSNLSRVVPRGPVRYYHTFCMPRRSPHSQFTEMCGRQSAL